MRDDGSKISPARFERGMTPRALWLSMVKALRPMAKAFRRGIAPKEVALGWYVTQRESNEKFGSANDESSSAS